jgi:sulfoxide reductase catalytic subunit YedY
MLIRRSQELRYSDVTPKQVYTNRREFLGGLAGLGLAGNAAAEGRFAGAAKHSPFDTDEKITPANDVAHYNNYYEFGTSKTDPATQAQKLRTEPWSVSVEGLVAKPRKYDVAELLKLAPLEQRIYRHRCVERWSIVVPWIGFPLTALIKDVEPTAKAKYVAFQSFYDGKMMLSQFSAGIGFPYVEGLRMDEAMHPLALLTFGMYEDELPKQDGAPVRLVVPWKYGYKSIKSLVKIKFVSSEPPITWNLANPGEYGFYSNVNPEVDHPRWSQKLERRLGELLPRKTLPFNGYGNEVAKLYQGMDLKKYH